MDNLPSSCEEMLEQAKEKPSCEKEAIEQCTGLLHRAAHKNKAVCEKIKSSLRAYTSSEHPMLQEEFENLNCDDKPNLRNTKPTELSMSQPIPTESSSWLLKSLSSTSILGLITGVTIFGLILKLGKLAKKGVIACMQSDRKQAPTCNRNDEKIEMINNDDES